VFQPPPSAFTGSGRLPDRRGLNFDGCSAQALLERARVRSGRIVFPGGATYQLLVLPNCETMTPELLRKLEALVKAGAVVMGNPPRKSPSLVNYPTCDREVARRAKALWGGLVPPSGQSVRPYGKGRIIWGEELSAGRLNPQPPPAPLYPHYDLAAAALRDLGVSEDFVCPEPVRYTHRRTADREIYFVANRTDQPLQTTAAFRVGTGAPELWNPMTGQVRSLPQYRRGAGDTEIPLHFEPFESYFVVFPTRRSAAVASPGAGARNFSECTELQTLTGAWDVSFDASLGAPASVRFETLQDWTQRPEPGIKYYSGIAAYRTTFHLPAEPVAAASQAILLDLGQVRVMARVRVNGADCGVVWTAPWRVDISRALKPGSNTLEIEVANLWPNRMIGDAALPELKFARTTYRPYKAGDPLLPSGLLGPVRLLKAAD
jgi:hypothetical protein